MITTFLKGQEVDKIWIKVVDDSTNVEIGLAHIYSTTGIDTLTHYLYGTITLDKRSLTDSLLIGDNNGHKYVTIYDFKKDSLVVRLKQQTLENFSFEIPFLPLKTIMFKDGTKKVFYPNDNFISYYPNGIKRATFFNGNYRFWNKKGQLISQSVSLSYDLLYQYEWFLNGMLKKEGLYSLSKESRIGEWKFYKKNGKIRIRNYR